MIPDTGYRQLTPGSELSEILLSKILSDHSVAERESHFVVVVAVDTFYHIIIES